MFTDGALVATTGPVSGISIGPVVGGWSVGGQNCSCTGNAYVGALDELAVYDTVLTGERVLAHWHASGR
jgi:hypothetical protein